MITIVPSDANWPTEFVKLARPLRAALGELALRIDHIGSTAVPGLAAKDRIDVQITIQEFNCIPDLVKALEPLGYSLSPHITGDHRPPLSQGVEADWEKRFLRPPASMRPMNLHVRATGRPNQRYPLLFRDYLRTHPVASAAYAQIKFALAQRHPEDMDFYYDVKDPVCDVIFDAAEEWARLTGWQMGPADM
jgi:GrpB-like predicted nucleotidyltransferase (UPF0157 family)